MAKSAAVTIRYNPGAEPAIALDPYEVEIQGAMAVTWVTPEGCTTSIAFSNGCPFPATVGEQSGEYCSAGGSVTTTPAETDPDGKLRRWAYTVTVKMNGGGTSTTDAGVVVTKNP